MLALADGTDAKVIHASSFSKTVAPASASATSPATPTLIGKLAKHANETYISPNMLAESIVWELCRSGGLDANIELVNVALAERRDAVVVALGETLPEASFVVPGGGYFLWLDLAEGADTAAMLPLALRRGRQLRRRPRLHARGRRAQPAALLRSGAAGSGRRGDRPDRPRPRAPALRLTQRP